LSIKTEELNSLRQSISLYKEKNDELLGQLSQKENEMLEVRLSVGKHSTMKTDSDLMYQTQNRELISSLQ
jgi:hypothetical protein